MITIGEVLKHKGVKIPSSLPDNDKKHPGEKRDLVCPECGKPMVLRYSQLYERKFYGCTGFPECKGGHGAHPDGSPLGIPADKETKKYRIAAHDAFDRLWKERFVSRPAAYHWLRSKIGLTKDECHIGRFSIEMCEKVIELCEEKLRKEENGII